MENFDPFDFDDNEYDDFDDEDVSFLAENEKKTSNRHSEKFFAERVKAYSLVRDFISSENELAINEVVRQCENRLGWQLEVVTDKHVIDDVLLRDYGIYDEHSWIRYKNSWFEKRARYDMHHIGLMHSTMFARTLAKKKLSSKARTLLFVRELLWTITKKIDRKIQKP